jgi:hypothetical protein
VARLQGGYAQSAAACVSATGAAVASFIRLEQLPLTGRLLLVAAGCLVAGVYFILLCSVTVRPWLAAQYVAWLRPPVPRRFFWLAGALLATAPVLVAFTLLDLSIRYHSVIYTFTHDTKSRRQWLELQAAAAPTDMRLTVAVQGGWGKIDYDRWWAGSWNLAGLPVSWSVPESFNRWARIDIASFTEPQRFGITYELSGWPRETGYLHPHFSNVAPPFRSILSKEDVRRWDLLFAAAGGVLWLALTVLFVARR